MDFNRSKMKFDIAPCVVKEASWEPCLAYDCDVRSAAMDLARGSSLAAALKAVRNNQEHRTLCWAQKLA